MATLACQSTTAGPVTQDADAAKKGRAAIRRALVAHGADALAESQVDFRFRGTPFSMTRKGGRFRYVRGTEARGEILDNEGFTVARDGARQRRPASAGQGVNSVVYFASLPYGLEDPAVRPRYIAQETVKGRPCDVVEVRFAEAGGGADHDDVFRYWFDAETGRLAYLAYLFHTGGGGVRFRVATGSVTAGGITFLQWANYGVDGDPTEPALGALPELWVKGSLPKLSEIVLEDVKVRRAP